MRGKKSLKVVLQQDDIKNEEEEIIIEYGGMNQTIQKFFRMFNNAFGAAEKRTKI